MRLLVVAAAMFVLGVAGCGEDCPSSVPATSSCSTEGLYCSSVDGYSCTCYRGQWTCVTSDDAHFVIHDLAVRDLSPASD